MQEIFNSRKTCSNFLNYRTENKAKPGYVDGLTKVFFFKISFFFCVVVEAFEVVLSPIKFLRAFSINKILSQLNIYTLLAKREN